MKSLICNATAEKLYEWRNVLKQSHPTKETQLVIRQIEKTLKENGIKELEKRYFVITNPSGTIAGDYGWIVFYHPIIGRVLNGMIEVCEEFSFGVSDGTIAVPLSDLTEITVKQYNTIANNLGEGKDPTFLINSILDEQQKDTNLDVSTTRLEQSETNEGVKKSKLKQLMVVLGLKESETKYIGNFVFDGSASILSEGERYALGHLAKYQLENMDALENSLFKGTEVVYSEKMGIAKIEAFYGLERD
ncbi:hypothetical protein [Virgibacillus halodenitrificans]|uniref:hypothetical protein n=1 Tax=Virgibacillus halodenitrificans TaxID=1482 RepID=UPI000EF52816|nr:hypothetical protein [Virgibacillus halodenitrificans]